MAIGDIYKIFVAFDNQPTIEGKERYTVEIGQVQLGVVLLDSITSQYQHKSDFIKLQYYPIQDWLQAGLKKPSYIDINSTQEFDMLTVMQLGKFTGQLTMRDMQNLAEFIRSYKNRLNSLIASNKNK